MLLRTRILLFLFLFALVPLLMAVVINLPLVLERVDNFYRQNYLHDLRQDFRDLDQHLASRNANVRLLSRLPEPSLLSAGKPSQARVDIERARYTEWVNRILRDETDITEIRFLDQNAHEHFWLKRDAQTQAWYAPPEPLPALPEKQLQAIRSGELKDVAYTPLRVAPGTGAGDRILTLQLMAPISFNGDYRGAAGITIDISSLVRRDLETLWVLDDGSYLNMTQGPSRSGSAFTQYPGLQQLFERHEPALWENGDQRVIWVPMFVTESGRPLWVGRRADITQLIEFRTELVHRVLAIVFGLIVLLLIVARMMAKRAETIGSELLQGIHDTLETNRAVHFRWTDTQELEQLSADLTSLSQRHAIQSKRLREHTRELEQSNRYKSEFLANVSHELRTPLNSILLLSKMLATNEEDLTEQQREKACVIHKASNDLKALIDNILDLSKIEARQLDVHCEDIDLPSLLEDLRELMQPQYEQKNVQLVVEMSSDAPRVIRSDPDKIRQILKNFIANALKFTDAGEVRVTASEAGPPYEIELAVRDTGIGIPKDKQAHIFDAFKQADGSTSRRYGGTGLGLTISRQLAHLLKGDIRLSSEPGKGATFSLLLPATCDQEQAHLPEPAPIDAPEAEATEESVGGAEAGLELGGLQVMLLEADVRTQLRLSQLFQRWNTGVLLACDTDEAVETLDEVNALDILVFEPQILGENPCDTINRLLSGRFSGVLLIGLDGGAEFSCDALPAIHWLPRPVDADRLRRMLTEWKSQRGSE